jgi:hypothetical protein
VPVRNIVFDFAPEKQKPAARHSANLPVLPYLKIGRIKMKKY